MKRYLLLFALIVIAAFSMAQNLQLHYDMGKNRGYLTTTAEMFKPDILGYTFFFVDMDYHSAGSIQGVTMAYWEIARSLKYKNFPVMFHTEYNGGFGQFEENGTQKAYQIENAFLNGPEYTWNSKDFSRGFTLQLLHKYIQGKHNFSFQITGIWYLHLADNKLTFTGYTDFWREDFQSGNKTTKFCFNAEPQIWCNISSHFSLGGEVELDNNFAGQHGFHAMPTLGAKYTF